MKSIILLVLKVVAVKSNITSDAWTADTPYLTPSPVSDVTLNSSLTLRCTGGYPLVLEDPQNKMYQSEKNDSFYISELVIEKASNKNRGEYFCRYIGNTNSTSVKVFVNDPDNLIYLQHHPALIQCSDAILLPCTSTYSKASLSFQIDHQNRTPIDQNDQDFDPFVGVRIRELDTINNILCIAELNNGKNQTVNFTVKRPASFHPSNYILTTNCHAKSIIAVLNQTVDLKCVLKRHDGSYADHVAMTVRWVEDNNAIVAYKQNACHNKPICALINIFDIQESDAGSYLCEAYDQCEETFLQETCVLKVYDKKPPQDFILKLDPAPSSLQISGTLLLAVDINVTYPDRFNEISFNWFKDGVRLTENDVINIRMSKRFSQLKIRNLSYKDSGLYSFSGISSDTLNNVSHRLTVKGKPEVEILRNSSRSHFTFGERCILHCTVLAYPPPNITWFWEECYNYSVCVGNWTPLENDTDVVISYVLPKNSTDYRTDTFLEVTVKRRGIYRCSAVNEYGENSSVILSRMAEPGSKGKIKDPRSENIILYSTVIISIMLLMCIVMFFIVSRYYNRKQQRDFRLKQADGIHLKSLEMDDGECEPFDVAWEFPKDRLKLGKTLGEGMFGRVVMAEARCLQRSEILTTVAVKLVKEQANINQRNALLAELKILAKVGHHLNIVNLLGAVTKYLNKGELMVIVEYCKYGNLQRYLRYHRKNFVNQIDPITGNIDDSRFSFVSCRTTRSSAEQRNFAVGVDPSTFKSLSPSYIELLVDQSGSQGSSQSENDLRDPSSSTQVNNYQRFSCEDNVFVTTKDLLCYSFQCARGMDYLASQKVIHRDLAARNVLLAENGIIKICDFGLAKDLYEYGEYVKKSDGKLPIKWLAMESIQDKVFTTQSDVWSFGILLWEIFSLGRVPYPGVDLNEQFFKRLLQGYRMEQPEYAPDSIYTVMKDCWEEMPNKRPTFTVLVETLEQLLEESVRKHYIDLNQPYMELKHLLCSDDYLVMTGAKNGQVQYLNLSGCVDDKEYDSKEVNNETKHKATNIYVSDNSIAVMKNYANLPRIEENSC